MSGWWFSASASSATRLTNAIASINESNSKSRSSAPSTSLHSSTRWSITKRRGKDPVRRDTNKAMTTLVSARIGDMAARDWVLDLRADAHVREEALAELH